MCLLRRIPRKTLPSTGRGEAMRKKLKSRRGMTIVEMLVALILLSLLTAGGVSSFSDKDVTLKFDSGHLVSVTTDAAGAEEKRRMLSEDTYSGLRLENLQIERVASALPGGGGTPERTVFTINFAVHGDRYSEA